MKAVIVVLLALLVVASGCVQPSQTNDSQNDANSIEQKLFNIKIPQGWEKEEKEIPYGTQIILREPLEGEGDSFRETIALEIINNLKVQATLESYLQETLQNFDEAGINLTVESITLSGLPAVKTRYTRPGNMSIEDISATLIIKKRIFNLQFLAEKSKYSEYEPIFNRTIETFFVNTSI
jgi:hypothetical protein